ncbi:MAG TPA: metal-dependent transcriptional regulator [Chloroflexota bacterium]|nr:metal-dependent transcriptional regulator [Chloroflexota bacterium]
MPSVADQYLEAIFILRREGEDASATTLADLFAVSRANAGATLGRLARDGMVQADGRRVLLTPAGRQRAEAGLRRHLLTECFLLEVLGIGWAEVHEQARSFERGLSPLLEARIDERLGYPRACPHGTPIPRPNQPGPDPAGTPLIAAPPGVPLIIARISELVEYRGEWLRFCAQHHLVPGASLRILPDSPDPISVATEQETVTIQPSLAARIWVRPA